MIDSIIFYGAGSKVGTKLDAISDVKADAALARFVASDANEFSFSEAVRIEIITQQEPRETLAGFGVLIATEDQSLADKIWNLPNNICRVQLDRETGKVIRSRIALATLNTMSVEPMFAGSNYAFGALAS